MKNVEEKKEKRIRIILLSIFILVILFNILVPDSEYKVSNYENNDTEDIKEEEGKNNSKNDDVNSEDIKEDDNSNSTVDNNVTDTTSQPAETLSQKNAISQAKEYLESSAFSYEGLIEQLEYEKFSHEDAVYGVEHCNADWNEQAVKAAKEYLNSSSFSRDGLIEQLEYEKFTTDQATYAVNQIGL